jgi:hypothetical protein
MKDINEDLQINVNVEITKTNVKTGKIREVVETHNKVTDVGLNMIRDRMLGTGTYNSYPTHLAVGTGTTAETASDTALETEVFRDSLTQYATVDTGEWQYKYYLSSDDGNGNTISEASLFDASSGGNMQARVTFTGDDKTASEAWTFNWTFTLTRA